MNKEVLKRGSLSKDSINSLANALSSRDRLLVLIFNSTACKTKEIIEIKLKDISSTQITINNRTVPISNELYLAVQNYAIESNLNAEDYIFSTRQSGKITPKRVRQIIQNNSKKLLGFELNPKDLRKNSISEKIKKEDIAIVKKQVGLKRFDKRMFLSKSDIELVNKNIQDNRTKIIFSLLISGIKSTKVTSIKVNEISNLKISEEIKDELNSYVKNNNLSENDPVFLTRQSSSLTKERIFQIITELRNKTNIKVSPRILNNTAIAIAVKNGDNQKLNELGLKLALSIYMEVSIMKIKNFLLLILLISFALINLASAAVVNISTCSNITASGDYVLNQSLSATGTCLSINASNVNIDCNGKTITYGTAGGNGAVGINASSIGWRDNLTIKNCIITKSVITGTTGIGLQLLRFANSTITNNTIMTNGTNDNYGIYVFNASDNNISNNRIFSRGTTTNNYGIYLNFSANSNTLSFNNITTNGTTTNHGIFVTSNSNSNKINNNNISTSGTSTNYGIYLLGTTINKVNNNNITSNNIKTSGAGASNHGIYLSTNTSSNIIAANNIIANGTTTNYGIYLLGAANANSEHNLINSNNITVFGTAAAVSNIGTFVSTNTNFNNITNNNVTVYGTTNSQGIEILGTATLASNKNLIYNNYIFVNGSNVAAATDYGIYITANANNNNITSNNVTTVGSTTGYGIYLLGAATTPVNNNTISYNNIRTIANGTSNFGIYLTINANGNNITYNNISTRGSSTNYGIHLLGSTTGRVNKNTISSNIIHTLGNLTNNFGIYLLTNVSQNDIINNTITTNGTTGNIGIAISGTTANSNDNVILNNTIRTRGTTTNYGIYITANANGNNITYNNITTTGTGTSYGIYLLGSTTNKVNSNLVSYNYIITSGAGASNHGIYISTNASSNIIAANNIIANGTTTNYGIYLLGAANANSEHNLINSNNVTVFGTAAAVSNIGTFVSTNTNFNNITNNNVTVYGTTNSQGIEILGTAALTSNNNLLYNNYIFVNGSNVAAATDYGIYITANANKNNISYNNITTVGSTTGYGIYLIGAATTPVNYNIISYNNIRTISTNGASNHGIILNSNVNNNNITYNNISTTGTTTNYGIYLVGSVTNNVNNNTIYSNIIKTSGTTTNNYGIHLLTNVSQNDIINNTITTNGTTGNIGIAISGTATYSNGNELINNTIKAQGTTGNYGIYLNTNITNSNIINNNVSTFGTTTNYGIYLLGTTLSAVNRTNITDNTIKTTCSAAASSCYGIYLQNMMDRNNIINNIISTNGTANNYGIYLFGTGALEVLNSNITSNVINTTGSGANNYGIYLLTNVNRNDIINNVISTNGTANNRGIYLENSSSDNIISNVISTNGNDSSSDAVYMYRLSQNNTLSNNIVLNARGNGINLINSTLINYPNNNILINNTLSNILGVDLIVGQGTNNITLVDQIIGSYNFTRNVSFVTLIDSNFGKIEFINNISASGNNLSSDIIINNNTIKISTSKSGLNVSANITLNGIGNRGLLIPRILRDDVLCSQTVYPSCYNYTSLTSNIVMFNISISGNYTIGEGGDIVPPSINFTYPTDYSLVKNSNNIIVNVTANDTSLASLNISIYNSTSLVNMTSSLTNNLFVNFENLNEGIYYFNATACDIGNNCNSTQTINITIDYAPIIIPISPINEAGITENSFNLIYNVTDQFNISICKLILNGNLNSTDNSITSGLNTFNVQLSPGRYSWSVNCTDSNNNQNSSDTRIVNIIEFISFGGQTTNLSNVNIQNIPNFIIDSPSIGRINFTQNVNLSGITNLEDYITISPNLISIDSSSLPALNVSAILTLNNLDITHPVILRDGNVCTDCNILDYVGNDLRFEVSHFTNYSAAENSQMSIWDDSYITPFYGGILGFYANYTNITDANAILGATCNIYVNNTLDIMTYNPTSTLYEYSTEIFQSGYYNYSINCSKAGFANVYLTDSAFIQNNSKAPSNTNITKIISETSPENPPSNLSNEAGNVTALSVFAYVKTQSWQGYYGNVSGEIILEDAYGNRFYDWQQISGNGEIYASRSSNINFASISCANPTQINQEEIASGQSHLDEDSISNTFISNNHPLFYVGNIKIDQNRCNSTNIYSPYSNSFYQVLLSDRFSNIVYTSILEVNKTGFNNKQYDFEMIVPENGHNGDVSTTPYYFYLEIG